MKVYFTASIAGKKHYLANYLKIIDVLKSKNCEVISDHIIKSEESKVRMETAEERLRFHRRLEEWINSCDFAVVETSFPSISVGYEISLAIHRGKHVLILYSNEYPPTLLAQHTDERLVCEKYNQKNLPEIIGDFINYVKGTGDSRFTFFITSQIASYLAKLSKREKIPRSVYLRQLIEKEMKNRS
jgi:hypothetical protein